MPSGSGSSKPGSIEAAVFSLKEAPHKPWNPVHLRTPILLYERITSLDFSRGSVLRGPMLEQLTFLSRRSALLSHLIIWDLRSRVKNFGLDHKDNRSFLAFDLFGVDLTDRRRRRRSRR